MGGLVARSEAALKLPPPQVVQVPTGPLCFSPLGPISHSHPSSVTRRFILALPAATHLSP